MRQQFITWYLQYLNEFITVGAFADYHHISDEQAHSVIAMGKEFHEWDVECAQKQLLRERLAKIVKEG